MQTTIESSKPVAVHHRIGAWPYLVALVWVTAMVAGMWVLWNYASTAGQPDNAPNQWPTGTPISLSADRDTLVMFAHPHCPCTRASLAELQRIVAQCNGNIAPWIVFYKPSDTSDGWEKSDLWKSAADVPGVHLISDPDGALAARFGAQTSGQTLLYDRQGRLLFSGGITGARGHEGDNQGKFAVVDLVTTGNSSCTSSAVFGCPIVRDPSHK